MVCRLRPKINFFILCFFSFLCFLESVFLLKIFFTHSACRADPVFREFFKWCSCRDATFHIPFCRIVNVSAGNAYISVHNNVCFIDINLFNIRTETQKNGTREGCRFNELCVKDYLSAFLASAFLVTSYMIGVAMKIEA